MPGTDFTYKNTTNAYQQWAVGFGDSFTLPPKEVHAYYLENTETKLEVTVDGKTASAILRYTNEWSVVPDQYFTVSNQGKSATLVCRFLG